MVGLEPTQDRGSEPRALPIELHPSVIATEAGRIERTGRDPAPTFQAGVENQHPRRFQENGT